MRSLLWLLVAAGLGVGQDEDEKKKKPAGASSPASNERFASACLKAIAAAQADFRANDRDGNRVNDFWVADIGGLYRVEAGVSIKLIEMNMAKADAKPCVATDKAGALPDGTKLTALGPPAPISGYWFVAVEKAVDEKGVAVRYDAGQGRASSSFGVCAYPAEYGKGGRRTFILNEANVVWAKDLAGKAVDVFPLNPASEGWKKLD